MREREKNIVMRKNTLKVERDIQKHKARHSHSPRTIATHRSNWEANKPHAK